MRRHVVLVFLILAFCLAPNVFAQKYEVNGYGGGFFPTSTGTVGRLGNEGFYGIRGGYFVSTNLELGANVAFINHFDLKGNDPLLENLSALGFSRPAIRAGVWEATADYTGRTRSIFGVRIEPFAGVGAGVVAMDVHPITNPTAADLLLSANLSCGVSALAGGCNNGAVIMAGGGNLIGTAPAGTFSGGNPAAFVPGQRTIVAGDNDFFSISYGAGIRIPNLWGPLGFRADVRGRTLPNFFGGSLTWPEAGAGFTVLWGER